ncbi:hypothetical protein VE03_08223 [Pseudogymnoascus sp. 23342-1-I1]|nr:hypothetical protein VE03_08216 [Pseudogymnoascus sp. 23342-1-I1]OBT61920.1 hypothetical protein VE03_08223 [Pseudogymnoascus sp. 23342-1-I1]
MDAQCLERLRRFHLRTVPTLAGPQSAVYFQSHAINMACSAPYLMHLVQVLTSLHDRHYLGKAHKRDIAVESYHLSRAAALFNRKLSAPFAPTERDSVWAAGCLIGWIVFCSIDATQAFEAWPLAPPKPSDLEWLRVNDAKKLLWGITDPMRADCMFSVMLAQYAAGMHKASASDIIIPPIFSRLYDLDDTESENGPYAVAVRALAALLPVECGLDNYVNFFFFQEHMLPDFRALLAQRDARALLLLAYWYAKICRAVWWIERRATLECKAVCLYLERYHGGDAKIRDLLYYPRMRCGMSIEGYPQYETGIPAEVRDHTYPVQSQGRSLPAVIKYPAVRIPFGLLKATSVTDKVGDNDIFGVVPD